MVEGDAVVDLLYLTWDRPGMTRESLKHLFLSTEWPLVDRLFLYDDLSAVDTWEQVQEAARWPLPDTEVIVHREEFRSPVRVMLHYLSRDDCRPYFAKVDNDIVVPPGWLSQMLSVFAAHPELELLGMARETLADEPPLFHSERTYEPCPNIGGVGVMRTSAFKSRPSMLPNGRFGFTEWQHTHEPVRGWVSPPLPVTEIDRVPMDEWRRESELAVSSGSQRVWPEYNPALAEYWEWWS